MKSGLLTSGPWGLKGFDSLMHLSIGMGGRERDRLPTIMPTFQKVPYQRKIPIAPSTEHKQEKMHPQTKRENCNDGDVLFVSPNADE